MSNSEQKELLLKKLEEQKKLMLENAELIERLFPESGHWVELYGAAEITSYWIKGFAEAINPS